MSDFNFKNEIQQGVSRVNQLIDTNVLQEPDCIFHRSVLIEVLVHMKDLLVKCDKIGERISFDDDVIREEKPRVHDVTDLISNFRDASVHSDSFRLKVGHGILSFNVGVGKVILFSLGDLVIEGKYEDDIVFNMGGQIMYLNRHLLRAFDEVKTKLASYL